MDRSGYDLRINVGRWQGADDTFHVDDLGEEEILAVVKEKIKQYARPDNPSGRCEALHMATQVLVWSENGGSQHNLIAVYAIYENKLTML
jgi:hypothetical protein